MADIPSRSDGDDEIFADLVAARACRDMNPVPRAVTASSCSRTEVDRQGWPRPELNVNVDVIVATGLPDRLRRSMRLS